MLFGCCPSEGKAMHAKVPLGWLHQLGESTFWCPCASSHFQMLMKGWQNTLQLVPSLENQKGISCGGNGLQGPLQSCTKGSSCLPMRILAKSGDSWYGQGSSQSGSMHPALAHWPPQCTEWRKTHSWNCLPGFCFNVLWLLGMDHPNKWRQALGLPLPSA